MASFPENVATNANEIRTPAQLLKKSRAELTRPGICDWANSAAAEVKHEMTVARWCEILGAINSRAKKNGMKRRKFRKISGGPVRWKIS